MKAAAQRRLAAQRATQDLARLGVAIETTPIEALEQMLYEAAGNVAVLREMVNERDEVTDVELTQSGGKTVPHVLVVMYGEERDRLARIAKDCAGLGLDERKVRIMEGEIERLYGAVTQALSVLPVESREVVKAELIKQLRRATSTKPALAAGSKVLAV